VKIWPFVYYYAEKKHNNLTIVDGWVWRRLGLMKRLFNGEYNGLCSFQIALTAVVLWQLVQKACIRSSFLDYAFSGLALYKTAAGLSNKHYCSEIRSSVIIII